MTERQDEILALRKMLIQHSVQRGEVKLSSGEISDIYVDAKLTTLRAQAMPLIGHVFLRKILDHGWVPQAVGGLTLGADPIALAIARESLNADGIGAIDAFTVRKEPKKHGKQRHIEGIDDPRGIRVVIIDDVCTTGESTAQAIRKAKDVGMEIIGALCLVDRETGASDRLRREFGYTLDCVFRLSELSSGLDEPHQPPELVEAG